MKISSPKQFQKAIERFNELCSLPALSRRQQREVKILGKAIKAFKGKSDEATKMATRDVRTKHFLMN